MAIPQVSVRKSGSSFGGWMSIRNLIDMDDVEITSTFESSEDHPLENLTARNADQIARIIGIEEGSTSFSIKVNLLKKYPIDVLGLFTTRSTDPVHGDTGSTLSGVDTIRHRLLDSDDTTVLYDSGIIEHGMLPGLGVHCNLINTGIEAQYWELIIDAPSLIIEPNGSETADPGFMDIFRLWIGDVFNFDINASYGASIEFPNNSTVTRPENGIVDQVFIGEPYRVLSLTFDQIKESEYTKLLDIERIVSQQMQLLFGLDKNDISRTTLLARSEPTGGINYLGPARFRKRFTLIESY
jgi:hypothetical protein